MRSAAAFLALLLCLYGTRAHGESGGGAGSNIPHILAVKAAADQTNVSPDIWAELRELRDMVMEHRIRMEKLELENTGLFIHSIIY